MARRQIRINNTKTPKKQVINEKIIEDNSKVIFNFSYSNWFKGYKTKKMTTFTENKSVYHRNLSYIFEELIPFVYEKWSSSTQFGHCHSLSDLNKSRDREANDKYREIISYLHPNISIEEEIELFQLGLTGSVRLICGKIDNTLFPLLIDHYHLGYDSKKYNQKDFSKFNYCPTSEY